MAWPFTSRRSESPDATAQMRKTSIPRVTRRRGLPIGSAVRSYDAAQVDRYTAGWGSQPMTADDIIDRNQKILVARSREQAANNDYMKNYLRLCRQNIVGSRGISLQAQAKDGDRLDTAANDALELFWHKWCRAENCDHKGRRSFRLILQGAITAAAKDGEFMIRELRGKAAGPMGYALQTLDPQRCPVDYNIDRLSGGRFVRQGIEYSSEGRALAYYFMRYDNRGTGYAHGSSSLDRIAAGEIIHGFVEDVEGQRRGIPWAATALWRMKMLAGFEKSALVNARIGAAKTGFIEWDPEFAPDEEDDDEEFVIEHAGGEIQELPVGAKFKEWNPQYPSGEFSPFRKAMLQGAGAGLGVAYVSFANDLEGVNFSSIRQGVLDEREHWMDLQEWLIETLVDRVYRGALEAGLLLGLVKNGPIRLRPESREKYENVLWQARRWAWVDPAKDIKAEVDSKNNLLTSPSEIIRKSGRDPQTVWKNMAADIDQMKSAGIPIEFIMASVLGATPQQATPQQPQEGEEDETGT
ncbi:phage portal protein [Aliiroseovarius zhejiangensis]|uniref:Phage portal protein n=1 Tax=Aliiroseovarius zhejiangensis TaxID=1632025 RepID=A0ABQ3IMX0_9RHOB|nr:phage portal protein [Aliiroseovarius zhejiangensis]GHE88341.1 phage portal protein [Aliiroseovarius zhejiangensis]